MFDSIYYQGIFFIKGEHGEEQIIGLYEIHEHSSTFIINREALELHTKRNLKLQLVNSTSSEPRPPPL